MSGSGDRQMTAVGIGGAAVIRSIAVTWRVHRVDMEFHAEARRHSPKIIYAFWHGRLLPLLMAHRNEQIRVLASRHRDGEMLGQVIRRLGYGHVRGSSTRGGARAIRELVSTIASGYDVGLTVDGPTGPIHVVKPGAIEVARLSGAAIIPLTSSSARKRVFSSWDRFELPLPFTRVEVRYGRPVIVPRDADAAAVEAKRLELEGILAAITAESDRTFHE